MFFPVMLDLYKKLQEISCPISIFFLEYTLAPEGKYPTQLRDAVRRTGYISYTGTSRTVPIVSEIDCQ